MSGERATEEKKLKDEWEEKMGEQQQDRGRDKQTRTYVYIERMDEALWF